MSSESTPAAGGHRPRFESKASSSDHFAWIRTRLSVERTMMAWIRTAVSMIGFGFTIVQFFERLGGFEGVAAAARPAAPRYIGLTLIGAGVAVLVVSAWQYHTVLRYMWDDYEPIRGIGKEPHQTPVYAISIGMIFVGLFAFVVVFTRAL